MLFKKYTIVHFISDIVLQKFPTVTPWLWILLLLVLINTTTYKIIIYWSFINKVVYYILLQPQKDIDMVLKQTLFLNMLQQTGTSILAKYSNYNTFNERVIPCQVVQCSPPHPFGFWCNIAHELILALNRQENINIIPALIHKLQSALFLRLRSIGSGSNNNFEIFCLSTTGWSDKG